VGTIRLSEVDSVGFTRCLNSLWMEFPFKYLGMSTGENPRTVEFWKPIINKIKFRLSTWKGKILSIASKICLIKFVINVLPLFYMFFLRHSILCVVFDQEGSG